MRAGTIQRIVLAVFVATTLANPAAGPRLLAQQAEANPDEAVEPLGAGAVHEAFAEPVVFDPEPGETVAKEPPEPIEELPPDEKPEGESVTWIPGYWSWDEDRENFVWISGFWRDIPPGREWVPGYWNKVKNGWQWVSGYWSSDEVEEVEYLPQPPKTLESAPSTPAPSSDHIWVPGCWTWREVRYVWRPGYWVVCRPDWVWVPARYVWTPGGFIFVDGYWDLPVVRRGVLFAPVAYRAPVYVRPAYRYTPSVVVNLSLFTTHLWVRPTRGCYYFGDYYAPRYRTVGYQPWCHFHTGHHGYDPIFVHRQYTEVHVHKNTTWVTSIQRDYHRHVDVVDTRPARTYSATNVAVGVAGGAAGVGLLASFSQTREIKDSPLKYQKVDQAKREEFAQLSHKTREYSRHREKLEQVADAGFPGTREGRPPRGEGDRGEGDRDGNRDGGERGGPREGGPGREGRDNPPRGKDIGPKLEGPKVGPDKPDFKPGEKPDTKPDFKPDIKPDLKSDIKPDFKSDTKPDYKPDGKPGESPTRVGDRADRTERIVAESKPSDGAGKPRRVKKERSPVADPTPKENRVTRDVPQRLDQPKASGGERIVGEKSNGEPTVGKDSGKPSIERGKPNDRPGIVGDDAGQPRERSGAPTRTRGKMEREGAAGNEKPADAPERERGGRPKETPRADNPPRETPRNAPKAEPRNTPKPEAPKADLPKVERPRVETPRVEPPKASSRGDSPRNAPRNEAPKNPPKVETPRNPPRAETPKPRTETPKPRNEAPKPRTETPRAETPRNPPRTNTSPPRNETNKEPRNRNRNDRTDRNNKSTSAPEPIRSNVARTIPAAAATPANARAAARPNLPATRPEINAERAERKGSGRTEANRGEPRTNNRALTASSARNETRGNSRDERPREPATNGSSRDRQRERRD